jgi:hypothetical protein
MPAYLLLCNYTDQGIRNIKEVPSRRAAGRELGKKLGIDTKAEYLAIGAMTSSSTWKLRAMRPLLRFSYRTGRRETCGRPR